MNAREAEAVLALLHHLDGSQDADPDALLPDLLTLHAAAAAAFRGGALPLDEDVLRWTLGEVSQRFADGLDWDDEPERATETVEVGERL